MRKLTKDSTLTSDQNIFESESDETPVLYSEDVCMLEYQQQPFYYDDTITNKKLSHSVSIEEVLWSEDTEMYEYTKYYGEEAGESHPSFENLEKHESVSTPERPVQKEIRKKSLFVHSAPAHFPDINRARKSVFGSIFLMTPDRVAEEANIFRNLVGSNYSLVQSLLNSFDRILSETHLESDRRLMTLAYKESLMTGLENQGIIQTYSDGSIHWNVYPITQSYLFSLQVGDHIHQTRNLSRVENRIVTGPVKKLKFPFLWPTDSIWNGYWDNLGMAGDGTYVMPHGVTYKGKMKDGMFHDDNASLVFPNKFRATHCVYVKGKLISCQFQFPDTLNHEKENWNYCKFPDRRFWSEVRNGLKPAKNAQKTELDPPRKIPPGCYDTNDGFYNPKTLMLNSPSGDLLRVPKCEEDIWIKNSCRKGFFQPTGYRPDLYENWFKDNPKLLQSILKMQDKYRQRKLTHRELQQFYADHDMLSPFSKIKKKLSPSELDFIEFIKSIPKPVPLKKPRKVKKYKGHKLDDDVLLTIYNAAHEDDKPDLSKSFTDQGFKQKQDESHVGIQDRPSKISFRTSIQFSDSLKSLYSEYSAMKTSVEKSNRRRIDEKFLQPQSISRPSFKTRVDIEPPPICSKKLAKGKKCSRETLDVEGDPASFSQDSKLLQKFMRGIIMEAATIALLRERRRHRNRLLWAQKIASKPVKKSLPEEKCVRVLERLFASIPEKEEYCDSDPSRACDLRKLAEDKYQILKLWGTKIYTLQYDDEPDAKK